MPLRKGSSRAAVGGNIRQLRAEGRPRAQAIAIAFRTAGIPKPMRVRPGTRRLSEVGR